MKRKILRSIFLLLYYTVVSDLIIVRFTVQNESGEKVTHTFCKGKVAVSGGGGLSAGNSLKQKEFLPGYAGYGKSAPLKRNLQIIDYADLVIAFWDGSSRGTRYVIEHCKKRGKKVAVYQMG